MPSPAKAFSVPLPLIAPKNPIETVLTEPVVMAVKDCQVL